MFYICDNCENSFSDNDSLKVINGNGNYCCAECADEKKEDSDENIN